MFFFIADCTRSCPTGGALNADCSQCMCSGDSIDGRVTDRDSSLSLANVNIYTVGREWIASAVSGSDGRFTISGVCVDGLKLTAKKGGYESVLQEYIVISGSSVNMVMFKLGRSVETSEYASGSYVCECFL